MDFFRDLDWRVVLSGFIVIATMVAGYIVTPSGDAANPEDAEYQSKLPVERVVIEKQNGGLHTFNLEIAHKPVDVQMGLMFRKKMDKDHGMLFLMGPQPNEVSFWMKNTYLPLDMLFVARDGTIAHIHKNAVPLSETPIPSHAPVTGVIELNAGRADETGLRVGDKVRYNYFMQP